MRIDKNKLYFSSDLTEYLKENKLPYSKPSLIRYEKMGLVKPPRTEPGKKYKWRVYTGQEIIAIANEIRRHLISKYSP